MYLQATLEGTLVGNYLIQALITDGVASAAHMYKEVLTVMDVIGEWEDNDWYKASLGPTIGVNGVEYAQLTEPNVYQEHVKFYSAEPEVVDAHYTTFAREVSGQVEKLFTVFETIGPDKVVQFWVGYELAEGGFSLTDVPVVENPEVASAIDSDVVEPTVDSVEATNSEAVDSDD